MKRILTFVLTMLAAAVLADAQPRKITDFDSNWKFKLGDFAAAKNASFNDGSWRKLNVPHDWSVEGEIDKDNPGGGTVGYFPTGTGWYRKTFDVPGYSKSKKYSIEFDGVYMNSTVWVNGVELGTWPYGYSAFSYDLTSVLKAKGNVIAVRVDNSQQPNSRWYSGSGIYRHVKLVETSAAHFEKWGVFNYTESIADGKASVKVESTIANEQGKVLRATVKQNVIDASGKTVATAENEISVPAGGKVTVNQNIEVAGAHLWDIEDPYLYTLRSEIIENGKSVDCMDNTMGIRTIKYDLDKGFLLNGKSYKMKGVNLHHDGGVVGAAVPERVWERRFELLKESGCNAIRTAHNAPSTEFLDLCDRMGFLVMDEAFDCWVKGKTKNDYNLYYYDWFERDLTAMVARDRNHPSVVMWSVGNEIPDQMTEIGPKLAHDLIAICHKLDPTRLVTSGNDNIASNTPTTPEFLDEFDNDIVGYNYVDRWRERRELMYSIDKAAFPNRHVVGTETNGNGGSRGEYVFNGNISNLDTEMRWKFNMNYDYVIGDFMWVGIDYYGESRWPSKGFTSGYLDNSGFKKDGFWFFKSIWTDEPVLHLFPHWNWQGHEGEIMRVGCYTNCEEVELFVNGKSYGKKTIEFPRFGMNKDWGVPDPDKKKPGTTTELHLEWDVEYQPGEIKAVGIKNGEKFEEVIRTFGEPAQIRLSVDRPEFNAKPGDVAHVVYEILDKDGNLCKTADNKVKLTVKGGNLIGMENGNMRDTSNMKTDARNVWCGSGLAIIDAVKAGTVTVIAESEGLKGTEITFKAK